MPILRFPKSTLGPIIEAVAAPTPEWLVELNKIRRQHPSPASFKMLIDTGADESALDEDLLTGMGLVYTSSGWVRTLNGTKPVRRYDVTLTLYDAQKRESWTTSSLVVVARQQPFEGRPFHGLIGRDILDQAVLTCDGPGHRCSLEL
jgi:hypothetical protein